MNSALLWRLLLAHVVADFPLQPDALIAAKRKAGGLVLHTGIFAIAAAIATKDYLDASPIITALAAITVIHGLTDWGKVTIVKLLKRDSLWLFLGDQAIHTGSIIIIAYILRFRTVEPVQIYPPLTIGIIAIWTVPIIIELMRSELSKKYLEPYSKLGKTFGKLGMLERAGLFIAGFQTGWFLLCCIITIPRIIGWFKGKKVGLVPISWALAIALGLIGRIIV